MAADGNWKITINTPMGARTLEAALTTSGETFTGVVESELGNQPISGQVVGDNLKWTFEVTNPMPMKLEFDVNVDGDTMKGDVKLGMFGKASLTGVRA